MSSDASPILRGRSRPSSEPATPDRPPRPRLPFSSPYKNTLPISRLTQLKKNDEMEQDSLLAQSNEDVSMSGFAMVAFATIQSILAFPVCYFLNSSSLVSNPVSLAFVAGLILTAIFLASYVAMNKLVSNPMDRDIFIVIFSLFTFTSVIDLILSLHLNGNVDLFGWYFDNGEEYLRTAFGFSVDVWDASAHLALYLTMIYAMASGQTHKYRDHCLFWCGSVLISLVALIGGAAIGPESAELRPATFLNVPYIIFPFIFLKRVFDTPCANPSPKQVTNTTAELSFLVGTVIVLIFFVIRFAVANGSQYEPIEHWKVLEPLLFDSSKFYRVISDSQFFYCGSVLVMIITSFLMGASDHLYSRIVDICAVLAGAICQTQFTIMVSAFHVLLPADMITSPEMRSIMLAINGFIFIFPIVLVMYLRNFRGLDGSLFQAASSII